VHRPAAVGGCHRGDEELQDLHTRVDGGCKDRWTKRGGVNWAFFKI
jgi:hypothetical protein